MFEGKNLVRANQFDTDFWTSNMSGTRSRSTIRHPVINREFRFYCLFFVIYLSLAISLLVDSVRLVV